MIKALLAIALATASGSGLLDVREPSRAVQVDDYKLINATSSEIYVDYYPEDTTITIDANTTAYISHQTSGTLNVCTNTKFDGYCFLAPDSEDLIPITWTAVSGYYSWMVTIEDYGPSTGIGFYNRKTLPTNEDFFIDPYKLGMFETANTAGMNNSGFSLLPENSRGKIYKEDGTAMNLSNLNCWRYKTKQNVIAICIWTTIGTQTAIVAQNFYLPNVGAYLNYDQFCEQAEKSNSVSPNLMYWQTYTGNHSCYTNRIRFISGYYAFMPNDVGYVEPYYLTNIDTGYIAIVNDGSTAEASTYEVLTKTFLLISEAMTTAVGFLGYMVFPGITIGFLVLLPLIISLLVVILKMVKKG